MFSVRSFLLAHAILAFVLCGLLLLVPTWIVALFGMEQAVSASVLGRRAGMLFLGYGVLSVVASSAAHSQARQAILLGVGVMMLGLALAGGSEYVFGRAKWPILLAMVAELVFSAWAFSLFAKHAGQRE